MSTAIISKGGRITIPLNVRKKLGVATGDRIEFVELADAQFALVPAIIDVRALRGIVPRPPRPLSVDEMRRLKHRRG
jgi:antitoxin PrlF